MKKKLILLLTTVLAVLSLNVSAADFIDLGQFVEIGTYNGERLVWRVVDEDDDGYVLMSEKIVDLVENDDDSSRYSQSTLRSWLNEDFFESAFSEKEQDIMDAYTYKSILNENHISVITGDALGGSERSMYASFLKNIIRNYLSAYAETMSDKVFIPSINDVYAVNTDSFTFGPNMDMAVPTNAVYNENKANYPEMQADGNWYYWLRDAMYGAKTTIARCMMPDGTAGYATVDTEGVGVRPMCYINKYSMGISDGEGTKEAPYVISGDSYIMLNCDFDNLLTGAGAKIFVWNNSNPSTHTIKVFRNGEVINNNLTTEECTVPIVQGINIIVARQYDLQGNITLTSEELVLNGLTYTEGKTEIRVAYEDANNTLQNTTREEAEDQSHGYVGRLQSTTSGMAGAPVKNGIAKRSKIIFGADLMFDGIGNTVFQPINYRSYANNTLYFPVQISKTGELTLQSIEYDSSVLMNISDQKWYSFVFIFDNENGKFTMSVDGNILVKDAKILSLNYDYVHTVKIVSPKATSGTVSVLIDNVYVGGATEEECANVIKLKSISDTKTEYYIMNNSETDISDAELIITVLDGDKKLQNVLCVPVSVKSGEYSYATLDLGVTKDADTTVKGLLLGNINTLTPLLDATVE